MKKNPKLSKKDYENIADLILGNKNYLHSKNLKEMTVRDYISRLPPKIRLTILRRALEFNDKEAARLVLDRFISHPGVDERYPLSDLFIFSQTPEKGKFWRTLQEKYKI